MFLEKFFRQRGPEKKSPLEAGREAPRLTPEAVFTEQKCDSLKNSLNKTGTLSDIEIELL